LEKLNAKNKGLNDKRTHARTTSGGACGDFRLDTASSGAFGLCLCGHGKAQHRKKSLDNAAKALNALRETNDSKAVVFQHDSIDGKSCKNYVLDLTGTNFGDCKCGISKKEHANDCMPGTKEYKTRVLKEKEEAERLQREEEAREAAEAARIASLDGCERMKEEGNVLFRKGLFEAAASKYSEALEACEDKESSLTLAIRNNRAACFHQISDYHAVLRDASYVLERDPLNFKALTRRMLALEPLECYEAALQDARSVLRQDPRNEAANKVQHRLSKLVRDLQRSSA
jgi:tetratricopeptide (TPR) repeat protein